jgi:hypothetical protein
MGLPVHEFLRKFTIAQKVPVFVALFVCVRSGRMAISSCRAAVQRRAPASLRTAVGLDGPAGATVGE